MSVRAASVALGAIAIVLASFAISPGVLADESDDLRKMTAPITRDLSEELRLRAEFGLDTSASALAAAARDPLVDTDLLSIPLTESEAIEIRRRSEVALKVEEVRARLISEGIYGGAWIDNQSGGVLRIGVTRPVPKAIAVQVATLLGGDPFEYYCSAMTEAALVELSEVVFLGELGRYAGATSSSADERTSTVALTIPRDAPSDAEARLIAEYGPVVQIVRDDRGYTAMPATGD